MCVCACVCVCVCVCAFHSEGIGMYMADKVQLQIGRTRPKSNLLECLRNTVFDTLCYLLSIAISKLVHCTKAIHHDVTELVMDSLHTFATKALASVPELHQVLVTCSACDEVRRV